MAATLKVVDGLIWSGRGNSPWWGVGKNSVDGGQYYVVADLQCPDGMVRTRGYRPDGFSLTEREAALIATELYRRKGEPFPDGCVIDPKFPTGIKFKIVGRLIKCIDRHGHPVVTSQAVSRRATKAWETRDRGESPEHKTGVFASVVGMDTPPNVPTAINNLQEAERQIRGKVSEEDWVLAKTAMEHAMGERTIHPAVKKFVASLLEMEPA